MDSIQLDKMESTSQTDTNTNEEGKSPSNQSTQKEG